MQIKDDAVWMDGWMGWDELDRWDRGCCSRLWGVLGAVGFAGWRPNGHLAHGTWHPAGSEAGWGRQELSITGEPLTSCTR